MGATMEIPRHPLLSCQSNSPMEESPKDQLSSGESLTVYRWGGQASSGAGAVQGYPARVQLLGWKARLLSSFSQHVGLTGPICHLIY